MLGSHQLLKLFPYSVQQVRGPDGEIVWVERGVNPDNIFNDRRRSDWPYSQIIADLICYQIAEGQSLAKICREEGMPTYNVVCRWRREKPDFEWALNLAYSDRSEFYLDKVMELANEVNKENVETKKVQIDAHKWASLIGRPNKKSKSDTVGVSITVA